MSANRKGAGGGGPRRHPRRPRSHSFRAPHIPRSPPRGTVESNFSNTVFHFCLNPRLAKPWFLPLRYLPVICAPPFSNIQPLCSGYREERKHRLCPQVAYEMGRFVQNMPQWTTDIQEVCVQPPRTLSLLEHTLTLSKSCPSNTQGASLPR